MQAVIILAVVFVAVNSVNGFEGLEMEVKCKGIDIKIPDEHKGDIVDCAKANGILKFTDISMDNAGCLSRCIMEKKGFVDTAGKPHKENIMKAIDDHLPAPLRAEWKTEIENCLDSDGKDLKVTGDPTCTSYLPLAMCAHAAFTKVCD